MNYITKFLHTRFPTYGERNVLLFYVVSVFGNAMFIVANWLLFILFFMSAREFAIYESIAFGAGILFEIPSGAIADLLGKKKTLIMGNILLIIGTVGFLFASRGLWVIFIANLLMIVSFAFRSGSLEALVYDSLLVNKKEKHFDDVIGKAHSLTTLSMVVAAAVGGFAWTYSVYAPWVLSAIAFVIALVVSFGFIEPKIDSEVFTLKNFIRQNRSGFYYLFKSDFRKYTFSFTMLSGSFLMWGTGIVRILMGRDFGYDGQTLGYLISATLIIGFFASYKFYNIRTRLGDLKGYGLLLVFSGLAWLATGLLSNSLLLGAIVFGTLTVTGGLSNLWASVILNEHVLSKDRATAISTLAFIVQIPYVLVVIVFGNMISTGSASIFYTITGSLLLVGLASFYRAEKSKIIVKNI